MNLNIYEVLKMSMHSIWTSKFQTFLTMLGVMIGVSSVICVVAFAQGSTTKITETIQNMGSNLVNVSIFCHISDNDEMLDNLFQFSNENKKLITCMFPLVAIDDVVSYESKTKKVTIMGTSFDYQESKNISLKSGRFLMPQDTTYMQKVCVLGSNISADLFENEDPIGKEIKVKDQYLQVVGILNMRADSSDNELIVPYNVEQRILKISDIPSYVFKCRDAANIDILMEKLDLKMQILLKEKDHYKLHNQSDVLDALKTVTKTMTFVLAGVSLISLLVGGIGVMNIMIMSIKERTREIGIKKAIGAKRITILLQFLLEAMVITSLGGLIGVMIGLLAIKFIIGNVGIVPPVYSFEWTLLAYMTSVLVGLVFGMYPAYVASNLDPIEALRKE